jgi:hypothetical protein
MVTVLNYADFFRALTPLFGILILSNSFPCFFCRLVDKINSSIGQDPHSKYLIGVLDIYGFESFKTNRCLTGMPFCFIID